MAESPRYWVWRTRSALCRGDLLERKGPVHVVLCDLAITVWYASALYGIATQGKVGSSSDEQREAKMEVRRLATCYPHDSQIASYVLALEEA